jgi:hypothetical protein
MLATVCTGWEIIVPIDELRQVAPGSLSRLEEFVATHNVDAESIERIWTNHLVTPNESVGEHRELFELMYDFISEVDTMTNVVVYPVHINGSANIYADEIVWATSLEFSDRLKRLKPQITVWTEVTDDQGKRI